MKAILISGAAGTGKTTIAKRFAKEYATATKQFGSDVIIEFSQHKTCIDLERITSATRIIIVDEYTTSNYSSLLFLFALAANTLDLIVVFIKQNRNTLDKIFFNYDEFIMHKIEIITKDYDFDFEKQIAELMEFALAE